VTADARRAVLVHFQRFPDIRLDKQARSLTAAGWDCLLLARRDVTVRSGRLYVPVERAEAKLRYRSPATPAAVEPTRSGFRLQLDEPAYGVAAGQAAVLYEDDAVVGAGLVASSR